MDDLISRAATAERMVDMAGCGICQHYGHVKCRACSWNDAMNIVDEMPAVDAVPIKPLSVWLAGYAVPPKYTVETNPVDSAKARAEGWEKHGEC